MDRKIRQSREQEARGARQHGGRVQPGSGSGRYNRGDVKTPNELIEYKRTDFKTIRIDSTDLAVLRDRALRASRTPMFGIEVGGRDYVIVDQHDLECIIERRARELAGDNIQCGLGDAGPAESEAQPAAKVRRGSQQRERSVLSGAAPVSAGRDRRANDATAYGRAIESVLPRPKVSRGPRLPRADRVPRMVNDKLAETRRVGRTIGAGARQTQGTPRARTRASRVIGGDQT